MAPYPGMTHPPSEHTQAGPVTVEPQYRRTATTSHHTHCRLHSENLFARPLDRVPASNTRGFSFFSSIAAHVQQVETNTLPENPTEGCISCVASVGTQ